MGGGVEEAGGKGLGRMGLGFSHHLILVGVDEFGESEGKNDSDDLWRATHN